MLLDKIHNIFISTKPADFDSIQLIMSRSDSYIGKDIFVGHRAHEITLSGIDFPATKHFEINMEAFKASQNFTRTLVISFSDLNKFTNFEFITRLNILRRFKIENCFNVSLSSFSVLPKTLDELFIINSTGLNDWNSFPTLQWNQIRRIFLEGNGLNDTTVSRILDSILTGQEKIINALKIVSLSRNALTQIPRQLYLFPKRLNDIDVSRNHITVFDSFVLKEIIKDFTNMKRYGILLSGSKSVLRLTMYTSRANYLELFFAQPFCVKLGGVKKLAKQRARQLIFSNKHDSIANRWIYPVQFFTICFLFP